MAAPMKLVITLRAALEGRTIVLNDYQFIDGVLTVIASDDDCAGLARYFAASYNCDVWRGMHNEEAPKPTEPEETSMVKQPVIVPTPEPDERTQNLIAAINMVEEKWIDDVVAHPSVAKVAEIMEDSTVSKEEIVAAVERFNLVDDSPDEVVEENKE